MRQRNKKKRQKIQLENIDIREVLDDLGIEYSETGKNVSQGWIGVSCCWCGDESNHLGIRLNSGSVSCFKCGKTGTIINYLAEELNSFGKALDILAEAVPRELRSFEEFEDKRSVHVELPKSTSTKITTYHAGYLKKRGFDYKEIGSKYNLHYCGPIGDWANRIIVPITRGYKLLTYTSIDISDDAEVRYKHLAREDSVIHVKELMYGIEHTNKTVCAVVEGLFDLYRIGDGALCGFGTKLTSHQKRILSKFKKVIFCFDGDAAGRESAEKHANDLAAFTDVEILDLPDDKDPDGLEIEDIKFIQSKLGGK